MAAGFALDAVLGDPHGWPHPVKLIGKQIDFEEGLVRKHVLDEIDEAGDAWPLDRVQTEKLAGGALAADVALPARNRDHALTGDWKGCRECHIEPDWLLVYRIEENDLILLLMRTGTHADVLGM